MNSDGCSWSSSYCPPLYSQSTSDCLLDRHNLFRVLVGAYIHAIAISWFKFRVHRSPRSSGHIVGFRLLLILHTAQINYWPKLIRCIKDSPTCAKPLVKRNRTRTRWSSREHLTLLSRMKRISPDQYNHWICEVISNWFVLVVLQLTLFKLQLELEDSLALTVLSNWNTTTEWHI